MNYNPAGPWSGPYPVAVVDEDTGMQWEAYGPNQLKKPSVVIEQAEDCCLYTTEVTDVLVEGTDPTMPPDPAGADKSVGDTFLVCFENGLAIWQCTVAGWELVWSKIQAGLTKDDIDAKCVGGCFEVCGVRVGVATNRMRRIANFANQFVYTESSTVAPTVNDPPSDAHADPEGYVCFTTPDCLAAGAVIKMSGGVQFNHRSIPTGLMRFQLDFTLDGGASWNIAGVGGLVMDDEPPGPFNDKEMNGSVYIGIEPCTEYKLGVRARLESAVGLSAGTEVTVNQIEVEAFYDFLSCVVESKDDAG